MKGIITDIFDDNVEALNGRPPIKKKIGIIVDLFNPEESIAVEFTGELRRKLIRNFKLTDRVEVEYKKRASKCKNGKAHNTFAALDIIKV